MRGRLHVLMGYYLVKNNIEKFYATGNYMDAGSPYIPLLIPHSC
jgi:hypothetical protein